MLDGTNTISDAIHTQTYTAATEIQTMLAAPSSSPATSSSRARHSHSKRQSGPIVCKNDIKIFNGTLIVNAVDDGIRGKDSVTIGDTTKSDGTAADNSGINITVKTQGGDGIKSTATDTATDKAYGVVTINGGNININSYADGISAEQEFIMNDGNVNIYTYQGSTFTSNGTTTTDPSTGTTTDPWSSGRPGQGGMGGMQDGNANKTDISAKGIKAVGLYDEAGTTWQSKGNLTINGGTLVVDSSDDVSTAAAPQRIRRLLTLSR